MHRPHCLEHAKKSKELPDPFRFLDLPAIHDVNALCTRLELYIRDYLSKATSKVLPRACRYIPDWADDHLLSSRVQFQLRTPREVEQFDLECLRKGERYRIMKAFLRFEMLCKVFTATKPKPDSATPFHDDIRVSPYGYESDPDYPFVHWDWNLLYKYENATPSWSELQLLPCVREYVLTLYSAIFGEEVPQRLPSAWPYGIPEYEIAPLITLRGRRFARPKPKVKIMEIYNWNESLFSLFASAGFNLLDKVLHSDKRKIEHLIRSTRIEQVLRLPLWDATNVNIPPTSPGHIQNVYWVCNEFLRLYRQRAWILFDNDRFFVGPERPHIPSREQYLPAHSTPSHRGGYDLEVAGQKAEWIAFGASNYPILDEWTKTGFWWGW